MIDGEVALFENGGQLKLVGRHLVVTGLAGNGEFESLDLQIFHKGLYAVGNGTEVVVVHLLVFGTLVPHQRSTCQHQVWAGGIESLVDEEIFLFPAEVHLYLMDIIIEVLADIRSGLVNSTKGS